MRLLASSWSGIAGQQLSVKTIAVGIARPQLPALPDLKRTAE